MARALPPLPWFRSFEAAARHLSFTAAAAEVGLTQPAISQQVRALETRLGVDLFARNPRGLTLTDDGRKLLPQVEQALQGLARATAGFESGTAGAGLVTVAASVSIAQWVIQPRLGAFLNAHPGVRVRLVSAIWPDEFRMRPADVEIRFGSDAQVGQGAERLGPDGLIAVSRTGDPDDLTRLPLIEAVGTSATWRDWAAQTGIEVTAAPQVYVDSYGAAVDLAVAGTGIALVSALVAAGPLRGGRLNQLGPAPIPAPEGYFMALRSPMPEAQALGQWLRAEVAQ